MTTPHIVVLYAEDSEDDAFLMRRAFTKAKFRGMLTVAANGLEALNYLVGNGQYADRKEHPLPSLILLDVKLPHMSGFEVLRWIRARNAFKITPVVMLTSSSQLVDVATAYENGADGYLVKPSSLDVFAELVADLIAAGGQPRPAQGGLKLNGSVRLPAAPP